MSWNNNNPAPRNFFNDPQPATMIQNQVRPYQFVRNEPRWNTNNPAPPTPPEWGTHPTQAHGLPPPTKENFKYYKTAPRNHAAVPTAYSAAMFALRNERRSSRRQSRRTNRSKKTRRSGSRRR